MSAAWRQKACVKEAFTQCSGAGETLSEASVGGWGPCVPTETLKETCGPAWLEEGALQACSSRVAAWPGAASRGLATPGTVCSPALPQGHTLWPTREGPRDYWLSDKEGRPSTSRDCPTSQGWPLIHISKGRTHTLAHTCVHTYTKTHLKNNLLACNSQDTKLPVLSE